MDISQIRAHYRLISLVGTIGACIAIALALWAANSENQINETLEKNLSHPTATDKDFILQQFVSRQFDQTGTLLYELEAEQLTHYTSSQTAHLEKPIINFYNDAQAPWIAVSQTGTIQEREQTIFLTGEVRISQQKSSTEQDPNKFDTERPWYIESEQLTLYPKLNVLVTDQEVLIASQTMRMRAVGLKANTRHHEIELLDKVRGLHRVR